MEPGLDLAERLANERRLLNRLCDDYTAITRSRFHALRMLWFSLKALLGFSSPKDLFAVWSSGLTAGTGLATGSSRNGESAGARIAISTVSREALSTPEAAQLISTWRELMQRLPEKAPLVSVVIPVYNNLSLTVRCLQSIVDTWSSTLGIQIVLVDDASDDPVAVLATELPGLDYARNGRNRGFVDSCNAGAAIARGKYVCFLNNDTVVRDAWLDYLVSTAERDERIGVVGAKLVYPDGRLQEAGGIIFRDGSGWNYGRGDDPADARYNYEREADYISGAALLARADLFARVGGFAAEYAPGYYEDADLCFAIRSLGYRVLYQPRSEVRHYEGASSGTQTDSGMKRYQEINRPKFVAKWSDVLQDHYENNAQIVPFAARRLRAGETILVIHSYVPMHDKEAGSNRLFAILRILRGIGYRVMFLPDNYACIEPYASELEALGIEVLYHTDRGRSCDEALDEVLPLLDYAWICRPELFHKYHDHIAQNENVQIIYDTIDLHFVRLKRQLDALGEGSRVDWERSKESELAAAHLADAVVTVTEEERAVLGAEGVARVFVVPTLHEIDSREIRGVEKRAGLLFIGSYNHTPNADAARWLCATIMPLVWQSLPDVEITLLGSNPSEAIRSLANERVHIPGFLHNVDEYFRSSRVFVAPLRFGAGLKGKIGQSFSFGLPVVTTSIGAEGFGLKDGENALIADEAADFARSIIRLSTDDDLWRKLSVASLRTIEPFGSAAIAPRIDSMLRSLARQPVL